jgi:hypothetical protein
MTCRRKPYNTREEAKHECSKQMNVYHCGRCGLFHRVQGRRPANQPSKRLPVTPVERRAQILSEFEMALATQLMRINTRLARSDSRVYHANSNTRDNGPLITAGGIGLAYRGDDVDVETKK